MFRNEVHVLANCALFVFCLTLPVCSFIRRGWSISSGFSGWISHMLPLATAGHHHCLLPGLKVSVTHTPAEILQGASDDSIPL